VANTKNLSREDRKQAKRGARKSLREAYNKLTPKEIKRYRASEKKGLKAFLAAEQAEGE